jgi:hypothetical protein
MTDTPVKYTLADALQQLVGVELSSVEFVRDYVQLWFDGPCMTAYTWPTVASVSENLSHGQPGYRDALCMQIGRKVEKTEVDKRRVSVVFEGGVVVSISLLDDDYLGPEALQFRLDGKDRIWVV